LTLALATASYQLVESPLRSRRLASGPSGWVLWIGSAAALIGLAWWVGT
jgi:peptidoglycan/LPS O-acetylase OafA/YrhL